MTKILGAALLAFVLAACSNSGNKKKANTLSVTPAFPTSPAPVPSAPVQQQPFGTTPASAPVQVNPGNGSNGAVALNPAHGLPGHRCDIPEGAPLNSAPVSTTIPPASNASPVNIQQPVNSNVRLNPAHGQPGHDCSVPVGQPLKS